MAGYSPEQKKVAAAIARQGKKYHANRTQLLAAYDAALTEAALKNPSYGDRDSLGAFQQRSSWGSASQRTNPDYAAAMFFKSAQGVHGNLHPGELAQKVQVSAFPARYATHTKEAAELIAQFAGDKTSAKAPVSGTKTKTITTSPTVDNSGARSALLTQYLAGRPADASKDSGNLLNLGLSLKDAQDVPATTKKIKVKTPGKGPGQTVGGVPGHPRKLQGGPVNEIIRIGEWFQRLGQSVREQPHFDHVDPVHVQGSYHYKGRAIDVPTSGNRGKQLVEWLQKAYPQASWIWNGPQPKNSHGKINYPHGHQDHVHVQI